EPATVNPSTSSSTTNDVQKQSLNTDPTTTNDFAKVLSVISPLPNITNKNKTSRQKQHSVILSSTPMKTVFEEKENKRLEKKNKTEIITKKKAETSNKNRKCSAEKGKKRKKAINKKEKVKRVKNKLFEDETETSEDDDVENLCADESEYSEEETLCAICCDLGKNNEMWYRCRSCGKWAHKQCSGSESPVDYICVFCLEP
ncbi:jg506, partial [Pararge aegeria aegeria]